MNLFFKIFLWFLAASVLMVGVALFLTWSMQSEPFINRFQGIARNQVNVQAATAAQIFENEGLTGVEKFVGRLRDFEPVRGVGLVNEQRYYLINDGVEVEASREIVEKAFQSQETEIVFPPRLDGRSAKSFTLRDGRKFVLILVWTRPTPPPFFGEPRVRYLRLLGLILTALLVCYALARYLSAPIVKLSIATKEFAAGNLGTRVTPKIGRRRDEFATLAADFDEMAERIETLVKQEKRLTQDILHELRSPLARLNVALEIAKQKSTAENQTILGRIETESNRLNEMISRLLMLSKLETGTDEIERFELNLQKLVKNIAEDADFEAQAKGKSVKILESVEARVFGNENLLRSAIENVVRNAVRYTEKGTAVEISLKIIAENVEITITDHGGGVPQDELENLFRPFYRVAEARERKSGGVGLGLAIARRAVLAHHGTIYAENRNNGLAVIIKLPRLAAHQ